MNPARMLREWNRMMFSLIWTGHRICEPNWKKPPKKQTEYSLSFVVKGKGHVRINDALYPAETGKLFAIVPGDVFERHSDGEHPMEYYVIRFSAIYAGQQKGEWSFKPIRPEDFAMRGMYMVQDPPPIVQLFEHIHSLSQRQGHSVQMRMKILFQELLLAIALDFRSQILTGSTTQAIEYTIEYMLDRYHRTVHLNQLAAMAQLSVSHYSRLFKRYTGYSPMEYLLHTTH